MNKWIFNFYAKQPYKALLYFQLNTFTRIIEWNVEECENKWLYESTFLKLKRGKEIKIYIIWPFVGFAVYELERNKKNTLSVFHPRVSIQKFNLIKKLKLTVMSFQLDITVFLQLLFFTEKRGKLRNVLKFSWRNLSSWNEIVQLQNLMKEILCKKSFLWLLSQWWLDVFSIPIWSISVFSIFKFHIASILAYTFHDIQLLEENLRERSSVDFLRI